MAEVSDSAATVVRVLSDLADTFVLVDTFDHYLTLHIGGQTHYLTLDQWQQIRRAGEDREELIESRQPRRSEDAPDGAYVDGVTGCVEIDRRLG